MLTAYQQAKRSLWLNKMSLEQKLTCQSAQELILHDVFAPSMEMDMPQYLRSSLAKKRDEFFDALFKKVWNVLEQFKTQYQKHYTNDAEELKLYDLFKESKAHVVKLNCVEP